MHHEPRTASTLSNQQARLWRLGAGERGDLYRVEARVRIEGPVEVGALRRAVHDVEAANDVLRTTFERDGGRARTRVREACEGRLEVEELADSAPAALEAALEGIEARARRRLRETAGCSGWRPTLVRTPAGEQVLTFALPALCVDTVSVEHLVAQLARAYEARAHGGPGLAPATFARTLASLDAVAPDAPWSERGSTPLTVRLPFDRPFVDAEGFDPDGVTRPLDRRTNERVLELACHDHASTRAVMLAAWRVFLWRVTGRADVLLGLSCEGRAFGDAYEALGPIDTSVPFDLQLAPGTTFADAVAAAERTVDASRRAQQSFSWSEWAAADADGESFPLGFEYLPPSRSARAGDTVFTIERRIGCTDRFDLGLLCSHRARTLETTLRFDRAKVRREDVLPLLDSLHVLLDGAVAEPTRTIESLPILTEAERRRILFGLNDTARPAPEPTCLHERIARQAERTPAAPAVLFRDESLSYASLDARSNQLARYLRARGVGPNVFVAIHAEPSFEMLIGILGTLKAGGAYVPLDPGDPRERSCFVLRDTRAPVLLTLARLDPLEVPEGVHVERLDADWNAIAAESDAPLPSSVTPQDLAYSIYTSGSTGRPKGVLVTHANLLHSTHARFLVYGGRVGRYLLLSSFAFDSSVAGIFWTLADGGALVLPEAGTQRDPRAIGRLMARHRVTHTLCLASHYALLLSHAEPGAFATLDTAIVSGEVLSTSLVDRHDELAPGARLFNEYGPTEGSVWSTVFDCHASFPALQIPIGRPIPNTRIHVLDPEMQPVPVGVPGEMYQGGAGVTSGYLNRPDLTAEAFVPDPFTDEEGARLYRTGDVARYLSDGSIEFLGRVDDQVKLRGYRIELGEIEAALAASEELREAAVVCREDEPGERYLAAYYACRPGRSTTAVELRNRLASKLPAYMVPSAFVELDALPRTNFGKLDRRALPPPDPRREGLSAAYAAPRSALEAALALLWEGVLGAAPIGVHDDYFELGGHSLLAARVTYRVREVLSADLPLRTVFDEPTVAGMARVIQGDPDRAAPAAAAAERFVALCELSEDELGSMLQEQGSHA